MKLTKFASAALAMTMAFSAAPVFAADGSATAEDTNKPAEVKAPTKVTTVRKTVKTSPNTGI